ncbi:hypothetical protein ACFW04_011410 [Cataglyphis niger]
MLYFIKDIPVSGNNNSLFTSHFDMKGRNKIDEILFTNISVIPESIGSILSKPTSPRAFVEFHNRFPNKEDDISVTFRWNQPEFTDDVIQGYAVQCWFIESQRKIQICDDKSILATILEHKLHNLKPNMTYYFQVRAHTKVGAGPYTNLIDVSTRHENPPPQLLIISENLKNIEIRDLDSKINVNLVKQNISILYVTYSMMERKIYWSNLKSELMTFDMNENNITKIAKLQTVAKYLCIDWVARNLYWVEYISYNFRSIIKFDLTMWENGITRYNKIFKSENYIDKLRVLPSLGTLYWIYLIEEPKIMQWNFDRRDTGYYEKNLKCTSLIDMLHVSFILIDAKIDDMNTKEPLIYWLSHNLLIVTNINASMCNLILHKEVETGDNIRFNYLMIDKTNIYISAYDRSFDRNQYNNYSIDYIYILKKKYALLESKDAFKFMTKISFDTRKLYAFGESLQPYPSMRCLILGKNIYKIEIVMVTINSIILNLPEPIPNSGCKRYNLPSTLYTIYISHCLDNKLNKFNNFTLKTYERYYEIQNLTPFTEYKLQLALSNFYSDRLSIDPLFVSEKIIKTKVGRLNAPENVTIQAITPTTAVVFWMPPKKLNCVDVIYEVCWTLLTLVNNTRQTYSLIINKTKHTIDGKFFTILESLIPGQKYEIYVRVYPTNFSDFYTDSSSKTFYMSSEPNNITLNNIIYNMNISWISKLTQYYQYIISGLVAIVIIICVCYFYYLYRQHNKCNEQDLPPIMTNIELAILHEIPNGNVQVNMLYSPTLEYNSDEYVLTKIKREQIRLEELIGSGAFGKVYRGKVKNFGESGLEIPAAIKMLRKNASSQEKKKFLNEARLMNHFRHKHVLRLLAVCLDQESPLIVLELMETDLLQYLRDNRKFQPTDSHALRLQDLFAMCEDIARGCRYLEDLRFVHRDLACRNCLVSARNRENRVVKIGDFGLARDVYENDYYRKKGQDLLPVRWMAPESLVIGKFTSQSDVWSFGVIMWEITSLGEQPYTGRTDLGVIDYIRGGHRLTMPLNCPPALYELMLRCWNPANERPNFKLCLKNIIALRNNMKDTLLSPLDII